MSLYQILIQLLQITQQNGNRSTLFISVISQNTISDPVELIDFLINNQDFNIKQRVWNSMQRAIRNWYEQQHLKSLKIEQNEN